MISIKRASHADIDTIVEFQLRLAAETEGIQLDRSVVSKGVRELLEDPTKGVYHLAVLNSQAVGCYLITYEWSDWRNGTVWWLQSVYVIESARKNKVFSKMYENIRHEIKSFPQVLGLRLYVDKTNDRAQAVYRSLGMNGDHYTVFEWMK